MDLAFEKILVANRGEIAIRICRTAKKMGIQTVAIYSTADKTSAHVLTADEAYCVGDAPSKDSYLNIDAIINIAQKAKASAIHPGYGFLSENPLFAKACMDAGIIFIGPSLKALEIMGSKQLAKAHLEKTKVPLTPGYHGKDQSDAFLLKKAEEIGFPILLKAAAGGGGKGMRPVYQAKDFQEALFSARREAEAYFADKTLIIEKLVHNPRHIEVQIMADNFSEVVHLFERDCSIQRRHQKIIEEAPAPFLDPKLREKITEAACMVARSIDYRGAGTVEFLVEDNHHFYFMEMNTRLQVEHPVTECITGLDLVAWQIMIAANEPLPVKQSAITAKGHAIECRIYAEDPEHNFMPSIGKIHFLKEPDMQGIRIDSGITEGSSISQFYDPMIAKLISYGAHREEALARLEQALKHYAIGGVKTNIPFLQAIIKQAPFQKGHITTHFLSDTTITIPVKNIQEALIFAAAYDYLNLRQATKDPLLQDTLGWQMHLSKNCTWPYVYENTLYKVMLSPIDANTFYCETSISASKKNRCTLHILASGQLRIDTGEFQKTAWVERINQDLFVYLPEGSLHLKQASYEEEPKEQSSDNTGLTAPMPATVVAVCKKAGDSVKKGELLMVLEAMKMEHAIYAPTDSLLLELFYPLGAQVEEGATLLRLEEGLSGDNG